MAVSTVYDRVTGNFLGPTALRRGTVVDVSSIADRGHRGLFFAVAHIERSSRARTAADEPIRALSV